MNTELIKIRDNLSCHHCGCVFIGSDSQAWKVKYENQNVYCSTACRHASMRQIFHKPIPERGPCPTCGQKFSSRTNKYFCSLKCYAKSDRFQAMLRENRQSQLENPDRKVRLNVHQRKAFGPPSPRQCPECGNKFLPLLENNRESRRKFCSKTCWRAYFAKRFDRWIANPETMTLPQCYDEFLNQLELHCLVQGCEWSGKNLSAHMNWCHGVRAKDFKRAAGFNYSTGVISKDLYAMFSQRALNYTFPSGCDWSKPPSPIRRYFSAEGKEHGTKTRALSGNGPQRQCSQCGQVYPQKTIFGRSLYCSKKCRDLAYSDEGKQRRVAARLASGKPPFDMHSHLSGLSKAASRARWAKKKSQ